MIFGSRLSPLLISQKLFGLGGEGQKNKKNKLGELNGAPVRMLHKSPGVSIVRSIHGAWLYKKVMMNWWIDEERSNEDGE